MKILNFNNFISIFEDNAANAIDVNFKFSNFDEYSKYLEKYEIILDIHPLEGVKDAMTLHIIEIPDKYRGQGIGKQVMQNICDFADKKKIIMNLKPAGSWKNSRKMLIAFYKKFGFIENKSNDNDYMYMYRMPK